MSLPALVAHDALKKAAQYFYENNNSDIARYIDQKAKELEAQLRKPNS